MPLVKCVTTFHTTTDDRDRDTRLHFQLRKANRDPIVMQFDIDYGREWKNGERVVKDFPIVPGKVMEKTDIVGSHVVMVIDPKGNDTWRFNVAIMLFWSDATTTERSWQDKSLSQEVTEGIYFL